jgi:hypothetical protein
MSLFYLNKSQSFPGSKKCITADYRRVMEDEITAYGALRDKLRINFSRGKLPIAAIKHVSAIFTAMIRIDERLSDAFVSSALIEKGSGEAAGNKNGTGFCQRFEFSGAVVSGSFVCAERL